MSAACITVGDCLSSQPCDQWGSHPSSLKSATKRAETSKCYGSAFSSPEGASLSQHTTVPHNSLLLVWKHLDKFYFIMDMQDFMGLPWLSGKGSACQCRRPKRCRFDPYVGNIPWIRKWQPTPVFLHGEYYGQRSLVGYSPQGLKELDTTERLKQQQYNIYSFW